MNSRYRILFNFLRVLLLIGTCLALAGIAMQDRPFYRRAEEMLPVGLAFSIALLFLHGLERVVASAYEVEFRRYLLRILAIGSRRGVSIGYAFLALADDVSGPRRKAVYAILGALDEGRPLSEALGRGGGRIVPRHIIEAVRAAERNGRVAETLDACLEESLGERTRLFQVGLCAFYPVALLCVFLFVCTYILPQFGAIFSQIVDRDGRPLELPVFTLVSLLLSNLISEMILPAIFLGGLFLLPFAFPFVRRRFRWALDPLGLRVPVLGRFLLLRAGERVCRPLAYAVRSGLPLEDALLQAGAASDHGTVLRSAEQAADALRSGRPADQVLAGLRLPLFVRARAAAAAAEGNSERLARALEALAAECQWRRHRLADDFAKSLYPLTVLFGGLLTALLAFGVFLSITTLQGALIP